MNCHNKLAFKKGLKKICIFELVEAMLKRQSNDFVALKFSKICMYLSSSFFPKI